MTRHDLKLSRRGFVKGSAGLTFSFAISGFLGARPEAVAQSGGLAQTISGWVTIGTDNSILIAAPVAEMGQGVFTTIPMIVAEELDADWSKVRTYFPPPVPGLFGNPRFGGILHVVASMATTGYWDKVRMHGAQARRVLMQAAGRHRLAAPGGRRGHDRLFAAGPARTSQGSRPPDSRRRRASL